MLAECTRGPAARRGAALLEAVVALAVLAIVTVTSVSAVAQASHTAGQAVVTERRLREASRFLEAVSLWTADDLDRRLGDRRQGPWRLHVDRERTTLYVVTLSDSAAPSRILLRTALYRRHTTSTTSGGTHAVP